MKSNLVVKEFKSIGEFEKYIFETPLSPLFRWAKLASSDYTSGFNTTRNFEEALDLLKKGWDDMAKKIENKLKLIASEVQPKMVQRAKYDIAGFQASVPRYLQGIPTNMINQKNTPQKQKVITIVKHMAYMADVSVDKIIENSTKALQIVKKIEAQGYRVNLDIIHPSSSGNETLIIRTRIKAASERMNVSKVAFPLVHPDMQRRMNFRLKEVCPELKDKSWVGGYGRTIYSREEVKLYLKETDYYLHNFIDDVDTEIKNMKLN